MVESTHFQKTPFWRLITAGILGIGTSVAPMVLLMFGLIQFKIISVVGPQKVTEVFGKSAGIVGIALVILVPLGGILADKTNSKFGRRRTWIVLGSLGGFISMLTLAKTMSIPILIMSWISTKVFYSMVNISCYSIVPEQVDQSRFGKVSGLFGAAAPVVIMIGGMLFGVFASVPVSQKLYSLAIIQLIFGILSALLVNDGYVEPSIKEKKKGFSGLKGIYPSIRLYPTYTWALLTKLFVNMSNAGISMLTLFYIARFHLNEKEIFKLQGLTSISIGIMIVAGIVGGFLSDKIRKQKPFVIGAALITGICLIAFAFSNNITWVIVGNFVFNFGFGLFGAVDAALVNRILTNKDNITRDMSIMNVTTQVATSLTNYIAPMIIAFGVKSMGGDGYTFFFLCLSLFSVLSALCVIPIPEMESNKENLENAESLV